MKEMNRVWINIKLEAVHENLRVLRERIGHDVRILAIVKADAYGHGAPEIAREIENEVEWFGVATAEEALLLRRRGIEKPILVLGVVRPDCYPELVENSVRFSVFSWQDALLCSKAAEFLGKQALIHLKIDTGMHRIGFASDEMSIDVIRRMKNLNGICLEGIFTHFAASDEADKSSARAQLELFRKMIARLEEIGITGLIAHCSNSAAALEMPEANMDMVRYGVAMYGMYPSDDVDQTIPLVPVLELKSRISFLKTLEPGAGISYGHTYVTDRRTKLATVPIGYGDGYPRSLSNCGWVLIRGKKAPILGRVCMDQLMVDVTDIPGVREDDEVTLIGPDGAEEIRVEDLEKVAPVFRYEFTCGLNKRVPRIYLRGGEVVSVRNHYNE